MIRLNNLRCWEISEVDFDEFFNHFCDYCCGRRGKKALTHCHMRPRCEDGCRWNFCVLRRYEDRGKPFANYLVTVARRKVSDWIFRRPTGVSLDDPWCPPLPSARPDPGPVDPVVVECLAAGTVPGRNCSLLLTLWADDFSAKEIARVMPDYDHAPESRIYAHIEVCKTQFKRCLRRRGVARGDLS